MSSHGTGRLVTVRRPAPAAAGEIRAAWDAGDAVLVLDPRAPEAEVERIVGRMQPEAGVAPEVAAVVVTSGTSGAPEGSGADVGRVGGLGGGDLGGAGGRRRRPVAGVPAAALCGRAGGGGPGVGDGHAGDGARRLRRGRGARQADATLVSLVPTMLRRLREAGADTDRFRRILLGGGPVRERGPNIVATYGLTETWGGVVHDGYPLAGVELRLGEHDEILVRAPMVMRGYRLAPAETAGAFTAGGWLRTGDAGTIDADGRLRVVDRLRDLIITGGVNVSPSEVEAVLAGHPGVADVCVAGAADAEWGERVVAHVVPRDPASAAGAGGPAGLRRRAAVGGQAAPPGGHRRRHPPHRRREAPAPAPTQRLAPQLRWRMASSRKSANSAGAEPPTNTTDWLAAEPVVPGMVTLRTSSGSRVSASRPRR